MEIVRMEIVRMGNSPARTHAAGGRPDRASLQWMKIVDESVNPKLKSLKIGFIEKYTKAKYHEGF
jgi:hypothetical protein